MGDLLYLLLCLLWSIIKGIFRLITWPFRALEHKRYVERQELDRLAKEQDKLREIRNSQEKVLHIFNNGVKDWFRNPDRLPQKVVLHYDKMEFGDIGGPAFICPYCKPSSV